MKHIRNFCIIAHIDHGKSTLADRLLEYTNTVNVTEGQMLDDMDLEKERGITIKSHAIQMEYNLDGEKYVLNLIDTPGHVDFSYEVSRSIAACEGCLLIVDSTQGVQAQTISNLYMAIEHDLEIIPVLNKCDMPNSMPEEVSDEIIELLGCKEEEIIHASGKTGQGVEDILRAVVERIPAPKGDPDAPLQALIFDSVFNSFRGIIAYFKIVNGSIRKGEDVVFVNTQKHYDADEIGVLKMDLSPRQVLTCGDVGYIVSGIKTATEVKVGDTITNGDFTFRIDAITDNNYIEFHAGNPYTLDIAKQDAWKIKKFDVRTLKPYDKVLVKNSDGCWYPSLVSYVNSSGDVYTIDHTDIVEKVIPFKDNEHLVGEYNDPDPYYVTWQE